MTAAGVLVGIRRVESGARVVRSRDVYHREPGGSSESRAADLVAAVRDDPSGRLGLAAGFYDNAANGSAIRPYRRAQLAFTRWQIGRGVLDAPAAFSGGSPWWRALNEGLLRDTAEAEIRLREDDRSEPLPRVSRWLRFLRDPSPSTWYRAHNSSIVHGYLAHRDLAELENPVERFVMNVTLLRVLYADCLVSAPRLALGRFAGLGRPLGDPRNRATGAFLSLRNILPARYPLDDVDLADLLKAENRLGHLLDYGVILPRARRLYEHAAHDLGQPALLDLIRDGRPAYAWSWDDEDVWCSRRAPRTRRVLEVATT